MSRYNPYIRFIKGAGRVPHKHNTSVYGHVTQILKRMAKDVLPDDATVIVIVGSPSDEPRDWSFSAAGTGDVEITVRMLRHFAETITASVLDTE